MNGQLRIPTLHLVLDLGTISMVSCFKNGTYQRGGKDGPQDKWMLYIWFQGATDVMSIEILEKAIFEEVAEAIDTMGEVRTLDTKWKNDLMIEMQAYLKTTELVPSMLDCVRNLATQCLMSHKPKIDIINDLKKQLAHVNLTPGVSASLLGRIS